MTGPGQVRIAVHAAGVNPVDAGNGADGRWAGLRVPCILGYDVAGVIDSVGGGVSGLAPGDRMMAMTHSRTALEGMGSSCDGCRPEPVIRAPTAVRGWCGRSRGFLTRGSGLCGGAS